MESSISQYTKRGPGFYRSGSGFVSILWAVDRSQVGLLVLAGDDPVHNFLCRLTVCNAGFDLST
jgi:hypothetical protein